MTPKKFLFPIYFWEVVLAAAGILFFGFYQNPHDMVFHDFHPHPFLFLTILIATRYGSQGGIVSSALLSGVFLGVGKSQGFFAGSLLNYQYMSIPLQLLLSGGIIGEIAQQRQNLYLETKQELSALKEKYQELWESHQTIETARKELEKRIAGERFTYASLCEDINKLWQARTVQELFQRFEEILKERLDAGEVVIYLQQQQEFVPVVASTSKQVSAFALSEKPPYAIMRFSQQQKDTVSALDFSSEKEFLFCTPIKREKNEIIGYILIAEMPFLLFHRQSKNFLQLIAMWISQLLLQLEKKESLPS